MPWLDLNANYMVDGYRTISCIYVHTLKINLKKMKVIINIQAAFGERIELKIVLCVVPLIGLT